MAIIGPNGAGKTTLLRAISGERPMQGDVLLNGQSLYGKGAPEYWLPQIGYVPVDSVLHDQLTVRQALDYIARLRLPNLDHAARAKRIDAWLESLKLADRQGQQIRTLSSGERKKANIAAELLTDPMLLLLDEPTSNLDPNAERELMQILRDLADSGKTVVVVTHTLSTLDKCHEVLFVANGRTQGPQPPDQLLQLLESKIGSTNRRSDFNRWADVFEKNATADDFEKNPTVDQLNLKPKRSPPAQRIPAALPMQPLRAWSQFVVLLQRQFKLLFNTVRLTCFKLLLGVFGGLFLFVLPADSFIRNRGDNVDVSDARTAFFLIGLVIALIGMISSFQEISREWRIYTHERLKGLSAWVYLVSKWVVLNLLVGIVAPISLVWMLVVFQGQPLQPRVPPNPEVGTLTVQGVVIAAQMPWFTDLTSAVPTGLRSAAIRFNLEALISLTLTCMAAVTLGLLLSALAKSDSAATLWLAAAVIFHVFMSGLSNNKQLEWLIDRISVFATSYWAVRGFSVSSAMYCWSPPQFKDFYSLGYLGSIWLALICYIFATLLLGYLVLRARDSWAPWLLSLRGALSQPAVVRVIVILIVCVSWSVFLRERSRDYYALQDSDSMVRVELVPAAQVNILQRVNGWLSQGQCPLRQTADSLDATPVTNLPSLALVNTATANTTAAQSAATSDQAATTPAEATSAATTPSTAASATVLAPTAQPTEPASAATPAPTAAPQPTTTDGILALPEGKTTSAADLYYGPLHAKFTRLPPNAGFTLLGRDKNGEWLRILWHNPSDSTGYVGWISAKQTDVDTSKTSNVMIPPRCAKPATLFFRSQLTWTNTGDRSSIVAIVVDVFRAAGDTEFPGATLQVKVNDKVVKNVPIQSTRGPFLLTRYTVSDLEIRPKDIVALNLAELPNGQPQPGLFATLFLVPGNCTFQ